MVRILSNIVTVVKMLTIQKPWATTLTEYIWMECFLFVLNYELAHQ